MKNYRIQVIDTDNYTLIMERQADTLAEAETIQRNMGKGDGYFTVILASPARTKEIFAEELSALYAKEGI